MVMTRVMIGLLTAVLGIVSSVRADDAMSYLDNGKIRVGVNLDLGGAITYVSKSGSDENLVNNWDWGRQIQMSFYSGPIPYTPGGKQPAEVWKHIGWNPIQAGDHYRNRSKVIEHHNDGKRIELKCIPMHWPLDNVPGECVFDSEIELRDQAVLVSCGMVNHRPETTQYSARTQELPAIYTNGPWWRLMTYTGDKPFSDEALTQVPAKMPWSSFHPTENWAALVNDQDWGLGVYERGVYLFSGGFAGKEHSGGTKDSPTGYLTPLQLDIIDSDITYRYSYTLILGSLKEIRRYVYSHADRPAPPAYRFERDRQHWFYHDIVDAGWPIKGELSLRVDGKDPYMIGPQSFWPTDKAPTLYVTAAFSGTRPLARIRYKTYAKDAFSNDRRIDFKVTPDGEYRTYEIPISTAPGYSGIGAGLRLDLLPMTGVETQARIKYIGFAKP